jgi:hypothetical protein
VTPDPDTGGELDRKFRLHADAAESYLVDGATAVQVAAAHVHAQLATAYAIRHQTRTRP